MIEQLDKSKPSWAGLPASSVITMEASIQNAVATQIEAAKHRICQKATKEFEQAVRDIVGQAVINMTDYYSMTRLGHDLVITVKLDTEKK